MQDGRPLGRISNTGDSPTDLLSVEDSRFDYPWVQEIFIFFRCSVRTEELDWPPVQSVLKALSSDIKQERRETDHLLAPTTEVKDEWSYTSTSHFHLDCAQR
jgi:hypothetical protein